MLELFGVLDTHLLHFDHLCDAFEETVLDLIALDSVLRLMLRLDVRWELNMDGMLDKLLMQVVHQGELLVAVLTNQDFRVDLKDELERLSSHDRPPAPVQVQIPVNVSFNKVVLTVLLLHEFDIRWWDPQDDFNAIDTES